MKKFICSMAFSLACCATYTTPAFSDVVGHLDSHELTIANTPAGPQVTATVGWTITNNDSTSCTTNMNDKLEQTYPNYQFWNLDEPKTTSALSAIPYIRGFQQGYQRYGVQFQSTCTLTAVWPTVISNAAAAVPNTRTKTF